MKMRGLLLLFCSALAALLAVSGPAAAQTVGTRASRGADLLNISATRPLSGQVRSYFDPPVNYPNAFRVLFQITSTAGDLPIVAIGFGGLRSDYIYQWTAFTSSSASCELDRERVHGLTVYSGMTIGAEDSIRELQGQAGSDTVASPTRPTIVAVDFRCDGPVEAGDTVTLQLKVFVLNHYNWVPADFTFENMPIAARQ